MQKRGKGSEPMTPEQREENHRRVNERHETNLIKEIDRRMAKEDSVENDRWLVMFGQHLAAHLKRQGRLAMVVLLILAMLGCSAQKAPIPMRPIGSAEGSKAYNRWIYEKRMVEIANEAAVREASTNTWMTVFGLAAIVGIAVAVSSGDGGPYADQVIVCYGCR